MFLLSTPKVPISPDTNPISQHFNILSEIGSGGPGLIWRLFDAVDKAKRKEATVFFTAKPQQLPKNQTKNTRKGRSTPTDLLRWDVAQLLRLKHVHVLKVLHPLEETNESLAFATEPVRGSLTNLSGTQSPKIEDLEVKCGVLQIGEALAFLHSTDQSIHGNICPESIYVTTRGAWKLAGFHFAERASDGGHVFPWQPWSPKVPLVLQPDLNYSAPECLTQTEVTSAIDIFSLGCVITSVFNGGKSPINAKNSLDIYHKWINQINSKLPETLNEEHFVSLREIVSKMLLLDPVRRPSAQLFTLTKYFHDPAVSCLIQMDHIVSADTVQKATFYCQLRDNLYLMPESMWFNRILPQLHAEILQSFELSTAVVRPLLYMLENAHEENLFRLIRVIKHIIQGCSPEQVLLQVAIIDNIEPLLSRVNDETFRGKLADLLAEALEASSKQLQISAVTSLCKFKPWLDDAKFKQLYLSKLLALFEGTTSMLQQQILMTLAELVDIMGPETIEHLAVTLTETSLTKKMDKTVGLSLAELFKHGLVDMQVDVDVRLAARRILPSLCTFLGRTNLDAKDVVNLTFALRALLEWVERKHLIRLGEPVDSPCCSFSSPVIRLQRHSVSYSSATSLLPPSGRSIEPTKSVSYADIRRRNSYAGVAANSPRKLSTSGGNYLTPGISGEMRRCHSQTDAPPLNKQLYSSTNSVADIGKNLVDAFSWKKYTAK